MRRCGIDIVAHQHQARDIVIIDFKGSENDKFWKK